MFNRFLAYFDYLGFSDFINRNNVFEQIEVMERNYLDIANALSKGRTITRPDGGLTPNLDESKLKCINFSDTVVFYSNDDSLDSLKEILEVTFWYNTRCNIHFFPVRGCVYFGEFMDVHLNRPNENNGALHVNSVFGTGLIQAHLKAENQSWAGTVIDNSIRDYLREKYIDVADYLSPFAKRYEVPYKSNEIEGKYTQCIGRIMGLRDIEREWVIHLVETNGKKLNNEAYQNYKRNIIANFSAHNKKANNIKVQRMLTNTLRFLKSYT